MTLIPITDEFDPDRCQGQLRTGAQCQYKKQPGFDYCTNHYKTAAFHEQKKATSQYRLQLYQQRLDEFAQSDSHKSLRDEIALLRILMETIWNQCNSSTELLLHSHKISDVATRIEKLVNTCERIERSAGLNLDKAGALSLASKIVDVITAHVDDVEIVDQISTGIIDILSQLKGV